MPYSCKTPILGAAAPWPCLVSLFAAGACSGAITTEDPGAGGSGGVLDGKSPEEVLASCRMQGPSPGRAPLRRLSNAEYRNTVTDLFASVPAVVGKVAL